MDNLLVQEIDEILKQKLPMKSSISGANFVMVPPDNTQSLPLNTSNVYRIRLPKYGGGYLARSKGQTGPFLVFTLNVPQSTNDDQQFICEPYALIKQMRILVNGVEVHNNLYFNHTYAEWLKKKNCQWLNSDGGQFAFPGVTQTAGAVTFAPQVASGTVSLNSKTFVLPFPDNYSILNNKDHAIPLEDLDIYIELYLNNQDNFIGGVAGTGATSVTVGNNFPANSCTVSNLLLYIPVVYVDPDVNRAIRAKLEMADNNEEEMMLIPVEDIKVDAQTWDFTKAGTKTFVFHSVSSSCRLLEAILSSDPTGVQGYKTMTTVNPAITQYQYRVDGKNVSQNPITATPYNMAYSMSQDLVSAYNQINNDSNDMSPLSITIFNTPDVASANATYTFPVYDGALGGSFNMVANLDTVSKELVGGVKLIGNLQLDINYNGLSGAAAASAGQANCYLIQHSNRIIAFSRSKCRVLK